jgi:hypothetical protein
MVSSHGRIPIAFEAVEVLEGPQHGIVGHVFGVVIARWWLQL